MNSSARWRRWFFGRRTMAAVAAGVLVFGGWHYWVVYSSLKSAQNDLLASQSVLKEAVRSGSSEQLDPASARLNNARAGISRAETHLDRDPLVKLAGLLPVTGDNVEGLERTLAIAGNLTDAGQEAIVIARELETVRAADNQGSKVALAITTLERLEPNVTRISELVAASQRERVALGDRRLLPPLASAIDRVDAELPELVSSIETLENVRALAPAMLGADGPRRYLMLALNNGELLPGGGLVTASGVVEVDAGNVNRDISFEDSSRWLWEWAAVDGRFIEPPGPLKRYLLQQYSWNLSLANWSPDFPTWSRQALEFYELVHGPQDVDGAVAIDLAVVQKLLALTGPITVEAPGEGPVTLDANNAVVELERLTRPREDPSENRKSVLGDLTAVLLDRIESLPSDKWTQLIDTLQDLVDARHIQVMSFDPAEQATLHEVGASGRIEPVAGDYLMLNEASVMSTKLSLILQRQVRHSIDIQPDGSANHAVRYQVRNPLSEWAAGRDPELVESLMLQGLYGLYLRAFTPVEAWNFRVEVNGAEAPIEDRGVDSGRAWTGVFVPVQKDTSAEITLHWSVPAAPERPYRLYVQQQPGMGEICTHYEITHDGTAVAASIDGQPIDAAVASCHSSDVEITLD